MRRTLMLPLLLSMAVGVAGCDGDETGPLDRVDVSGFWVGRTDGLETADDRTFELLLREEEEDDGEIEGSGSIQGPTSSIAVLVEGQNVFPDVSLTLISEQFSDGRQLINFRGEFISEDVIRGKLNGGGFNDEPLRLRRTEQRTVDP